MAVRLTQQSIDVLIKVNPPPVNLLTDIQFTQTLHPEFIDTLQTESLLIQTIDAQVITVSANFLGLSQNISLSLEQYFDQPNSLSPDSLAMNYYGTLSDAADYFSARLHRELWNNTANSIQEQALTSATDRIDRLAYIHIKTDSSQALEFPRTPIATNTVPSPTPVTVVPSNIIHACYEIAFELISGADPEKQIRDLQQSSFAFANLRKAFDRESVPEHLLAGIPSALAWGYLKPYLRNPSDYIINRG